MSDRMVLADGCDGDGSGLTAALGTNYEIVYQDLENYGHGHHNYDEVYKLADGTYIHAECGGCSCGGSGSFTDPLDYERAKQFIPLEKRKE